MPLYESILVNASTSGNVEEFKQALNKGADPNTRNESGETPLCLVSKCRPDLVRLLLEHNADPDLQDSNNISPIHWAVEYDNTRCIKLLLQAGAKTETSDNQEETPLHWAAWTGHSDAATLLLEAGCILNPSNSDGKTPLDLAKQQGHIAIIKLLENADQ